MTRLTAEREQYIRSGKCMDALPDRVYRELLAEIDYLRDSFLDMEVVRQNTLRERLETIKTLLIRAKSIEEDGEGCKSANVDRALMAIAEDDEMENKK